VEVQTEQICLEVIKQNDSALQYVNKSQQTKEMCSKVSKQTKYASKYIKNKNIQKTY
jgi:hypothetical protein